MNARLRFSQLSGLVEATAVFLFFYQALRVLFSVLFGLIYDALFAETASMTSVGLVLVVVVLALLAPMVAPRQPTRRQIALLASAVLVFLARIPLTLNDPQSRLVASILIVTGTGVYLASRLREGSRSVVRALILALVVDQLLRAAGQTWDVTLREAWLWGQVAVSLGLCLLTGWRSRHRWSGAEAVDVRLGLLGGLAWGGWLFLETSLLAFPNAITRWSDVSHSIAVPFLVAVTLLSVLQNDPRPERSNRVGKGILLILVFLGCLVMGNLDTLQMLDLPMLVLAQGAALLIVLVYFVPRQENVEDRVRLGLALGGILFLALSFAYAFTFTYPYTLELFRNMGLPVVLAAGLLATLPILRPWARTGTPSKSTRRRLGTTVAVVSILVLGTVLSWPHSPQVPVERGFLRTATYNIHYGYDTDWHLSLEEQARTIEASGADVIALQEVDTGRPTSYMIDDALWLARRLEMEAIYLPTIEHLTGIALLSRYPILDSETLLLPSELEQTGIIWAKLDVEGTPVNAFAIWLGLEPEERARQLDAALPFIEAHPGPAVFGGDFNSEPGSPVYQRIEAAGFVDPFPALGLGSPPTSPAISPTERIDFVWLRDLTPLAAQVLDSTASDHRLVVVEAMRP